MPFRANKKWALAHSSLPSFPGAVTDRAVTTEQIRLQVRYYTDGGRDSTARGPAARLAGIMRRLSRSTHQSGTTYGEDRHDTAGIDGERGSFELEADSQKGKRSIRRALRRAVP